MKWLITCFEPFDGAASNSSQIIWNHLCAKDWKGKAVFAGPLPVSFAKAWPALQPAIKDCDGILALGQAETRSQVSLECLALNWIDARIADNDGQQPRMVKVREGPDVLWSQIPWARLGENEVWSRSYSAGTFVCNQLMYEVVHWAMDTSRLGGFVHIPLLPTAKQEHQVLHACETIVTFLTELHG